MTLAGEVVGTSLDISHMVDKKHRSAWGSVFAKKDKNGNIIGWLARYTSLIDQHKVSRQFKLE